MGKRQKDYTTVTPYLTVVGVEKAIDWYGRAFGAVPGRILQMSDGVVAFAEMRIGDAFVMLCDESPIFDNHGPAALGGSPVSIHLYVDDADAAFAHAKSHGATPKQEPADQFFGDRSGTLEDPFGYTWTLSTQFEAISDDELQRRWLAVRDEMSG